MLVAARLPFEAESFPGQMADPELGDFSESVLLARFDGLNVFGLYLPGEKRKRPVFDFLLRLPERYLAGDSVLMGDLNTVGTMRMRRGPPSLPPTSSMPSRAGLD